jgi:hypothetical protein
MWFSLASALAQPTKTGSFGETLGNVSQTLGETRKAQREFDTSLAKNQFERDQDLAELGSKYDLKSLDLQEQALRAGVPKYQQVANGYLRILPGQAPEYVPVEGMPSSKDTWREETRNGVKGQVSSSGEFKPYTGEASGLLSPQLEKRKLDALDELSVLGGVSADTASLADDIDKGRINLSLLGNLTSGGANALGIGNEETAKYATFRSTLERLRNDSLRLNKGVQTEPDAKRAWDEMFGSLSSEKTVVANLKRIETLNQRAAQLKGKSLNDMLTSRGHEPIDLTEYNIQPASVGAAAGKPKPKPKGGALTRPTQKSAPQASASAPVKIASDADYAKLPKGTIFVGPDGVKRTKP